MGVYIKNMQMPTRCLACPLSYDSYFCMLTGSKFYKYHSEFDPGEGRLDDCPLISVPPHGDLVDRDAIRVDIDEKRPGRSYEDAWTLTVIDAAPTIIPASEEG